MKKNGKTFAFWIIFTEAVGALAAWLSREGVRAYELSVRQPSLSPPGAVFPIVWVILYALMGVGAARVYLTPASRNRSRALLLYLIQLAFNFFWSLIFFNLQAFGLALAWLAALWALVLAMIAAFGRVDARAALLQIPYLLWTTFAAYLAYGVWVLN